MRQPTVKSAISDQKSAIGIDWEDVRRRLADAQRSFAGSGELSPEAAQCVLEERARLLAEVPEQAPATSEILEVMTFTMAGEPFAIETRFVREVTKPGGVTPLPGAPPFLVGVTNLRGAVTAVIDLRVFFGFTDDAERNAPQVLVLGMDRVEYAMQVDAIDQVMTLRIDEILAPPGSVSGVSREFLRGVTDGALLILDGQTLLANERLYVDEGSSDL